MEITELVQRLLKSRKEFLMVLEGLSDEEMLIPGVNGEWTLKDILAHLSVWESELITLLWQAHQGRQPTTVHLGQASTDELNERFFRENRNRPLDRVLNDFHGLRKQTVRRVEDLSPSDLTDAGRYPWTNGVPLWKWIAADTYEHEAEHRDQILRWRKKRAH